MVTMWQFFFQNLQKRSLMYREHGTLQACCPLWSSLAFTIITSQAHILHLGTFSAVLWVSGNLHQYPGLNHESWTSWCQSQKDWWFYFDLSGFSSNRRYMNWKLLWYTNSLTILWIIHYCCVTGIFCGILQSTPDCRN